MNWRVIQGWPLPSPIVYPPGDPPPQRDTAVQTSGVAFKLGAAVQSRDFRFYPLIWRHLVATGQSTHAFSRLRWDTKDLLTFGH